MTIPVSHELRSREIKANQSATEPRPRVDLNRNIYALIENPLDQFTPEQLLEDVRHFTNEKNLNSIHELLEKGAQVAKDPKGFEAVEGLTDVEKKALRDEEMHRFKQPWALYMTIITCSVGAAVQGWDQTGSNGANLTWPYAFHLNPMESVHDTWIVGLVNAAPYFASAFLGCFLSDPLNAYFGRRGTIFFAATFCFAAVIGSAFTTSWKQLFICRLLLGVGMGSKASTIPVFAAENSPTSIRGSLVMGWQLWTSFGILLGFSANLAVYQAGKEIVWQYPDNGPKVKVGKEVAWRLQLGSAFIPAIPLLIGIYMCPESPRWYIKKNLYDHAYRSLCRLRNTELQAARDLYYIHAQILLEKQLVVGTRGKGDFGEMGLVGDTSYVQRFVQLFTIPRIRRATLAAFVVMLAQQMCGINIVAFYSSTLFVQANASTRKALLVSWGFGLVNFTFAWPAVRTIDTYGRRFLLLFTFPHMAWTLLAAGLCFKIPVSSPAHVGLIAFFIFLFAAFYSPGEGPVPFTYSAEAFPLSHREVGMGFAVATNLFWAGVLTLTFPRLTVAFGPTGAICFFAGLNVIALVMIFLWVPETKQRSLEELDYIFAVPTQKHVNYQVGKFLPWAFRYYIRRQDVRLEPLYKFRDSDSYSLED